MATVRDVSGLLSEAARRHPDREAVADGSGRRLTWGQLEDEVAGLASGLAEVGVVAGHRVLLALGNRVEFVTVYLALLRAQVVAVPVNPGSTPSELARMVADSGARLVLVDGGSAAAGRLAVSAVARALGGEPADPDGPELSTELVSRARRPRVVTVGVAAREGELDLGLVRARTSSAAPGPRDPEALAVLLYTSGTSGLPRAAMLPHRALLANIEQVDRVHPAMIESGDVVLGVLPLFHVYGLNAVLGAVLRRGARLVLVDRFDPRGTLDLVRAEGCTVLPVAPAVLGRWLGVDGLADALAGVRLVLSGSAPLAMDAAEQFTTTTGLPVHQGYGLTEAAPVVTSTLCSRRIQPGSVGAALPGVEVRLLDDTGRPPAPGDPGEIEIRGDNLFTGYWPHGAGGPAEDGWWPTGDLGFLDADGDLFLVDRLKDLVVVSGFNVYPWEVEEVLREVDGVAEAGVIGIPDPDTGEAVVAYLVAPGREPQAVRDAVLAHVERRLARFKRPTRVEVVDALPLTVTGKVQKGRLRGRERRAWPELFG